MSVIEERKRDLSGGINVFCNYHEDANVCVNEEFYMIRALNRIYKCMGTDIVSDSAK